ncbi:MAG TPA: hypothetical protein VMF87_13940 [Streptosporangiaceae bacterium]|nr:hypothetical protein [Streptosporangiaceae bacterium]
MSGGLAVPGGDPVQLQTLADQLEVLGKETGNLGASTRQAAAAIPSGADWTGDAADSFSAFAGDLGQGAGAAEAPLQQMAAAVRQYAGYLSTAQEKTQAFNSIARAAQSDSSGSLLGEAEMAGQDAMGALQALQAAGDQAATAVTSAAGGLGDLFKPAGPVQTWIDKQSALGDGYTLVPEEPEWPKGDIPIWEEPEFPKGDMPIWEEPEGPKGDIPIWEEPDWPKGDIPILPEPGELPGDIPIPPGLLGPLINYESGTEDGNTDDEPPEDEPPFGGIAQPGTTGSGLGFGSDGQPASDNAVNNYIRPPVEGDTNYQVFDPNDKGVTITDIDKISDGKLVEEKSATGQDPRMDIPSWVQQNVTGKLDSYYQAREYMPGYANAPFEIEFTQPGATPQFQQAVEQAAAQWQAAHPGTPVTIQWSNP